MMRTRARVGTGYRYTDLERLRAEWFVRETTMTVAEMAAALSDDVVRRSAGGLYQHLYRRGIWISEERRGERAWDGV